MVVWITVIATVLFVSFAAYMLSKKSSNDPRSPHRPLKTPEEVGAFYNQHNSSFLEVYGEVIQAFRTTDVSKLLNYQIESIGLQNGQKVIDAGCGVCGPARYFLSKLDLHIDAITISEEQVRYSIEKNKEVGLENRINVTHGDFQQLEKYFERNTYDVVYFLESFGHSTDHSKTINSSWEILKPGGVMYIKDLFKKITPLPSLKKPIEDAIDDINQAYHYNIADLNNILDLIRKKGFILSSLKTIDIKLEDFENLTISNDFQELTGINRIKNLQEYVFPVDFFELKCIKPWTNINIGNSRYFLQNLFYLQVKNKDVREL